MNKKSIYIILFAMLTATSLLAETFKISGRVVDQEGKGLKGAAIRVEGTTLGTYVREVSGYFEVINIPVTSERIKVSYTGLKSKELPISKDSVNMLIVLENDPNIKVNNIQVLAKRIVRNAATGSMASFSSSSEDGSGIKLGDVQSIIAFNPIDQNSSGLLTAGEVNDFTKWNLWTDISNNELAEYQKLWNFTPKERYTVQFQTNNKFPLFGAKVVLKDGDKIIWESVTDNTGKAELWNNAFNQKNSVSNNLSIEINFEGKNYEIKNPKVFHDGINFVNSDKNYKDSYLADIAFVVDATGSMSDEIDYLKADLTNIINGIKDSIPIIDLNIASVFYRDYGDQFSAKYDEMTKDLDKTMTFIKSIKADEGHGHSAFQIGLNTAINQLQWRENSSAKIIFLLLDASPKTDKNTIDTIMNLTQYAAKKGIRIVPVACSGIDKSGEYLLRSIALLTNGTYTFLTDDSHIGESHIKPTTDKYEVETFNALLKRLIKQYLSFPKNDLVINNMNSDTTSVEVKTNSPKDTSKVDSSQIDTSVNPNNNVEKLSIKCYPNPTSGILNIETIGNIEELFISDVSGKLITRIDVKNQNNITLNLSDYPNGTYYSLCIYDTDKILKGKFIIVH
jgi:hypothetical protein